METPVAIIGLACRFPGTGEGDEGFWQLLAEGRDAIREVPPDRWPADVYYDPDPLFPGKMNTRWGGFIDGIDRFDSHFFGIAPREANHMDPQQRLLLETAWHALEDAGIDSRRLSGTPAGVYVGISSHDYASLTEARISRLDAYAGTGNAATIAANRISYFLNLVGPSLAIDTACSSSLVALHQACRSLHHGDCSLAIVGGVNLILSPTLGIMLSKARMMAPDGRCKTFDARANGYVRGEGCGVVILKPLRDALHDGDRIRAIVRGSAVNQDGHSNGLTAPNGLAQQALIRTALKNADVSPADISYLEAQGTGTILGDPVEVNAAKAVLLTGRDAHRPCYIGSVKTNIGHLEAASGIAGLIKVVLALENETIPPHLHLQEINPMIRIAGTPMAIPRRITPWPRADRLRLAGVSAFGLGGTNAHVIIEEAPKSTSTVKHTWLRNDRPVHVLPVSAASDASLEAIIRRYARACDNEPATSLAGLCASAQVERTHFSRRKALLARSMDELTCQLRQLAMQGALSPSAQSSGHQTVSDNPPAIAFFFAGQETAQVDWGSGLYALEPLFRQTMDRCASWFDPRVERELLAAMHAEPSRGPARIAQKIKEPGHAEALLFSLEVALANVWKHWGIEPHLVLGQGAGEVAAAHIAGMLSDEDAVALLIARMRMAGAMHEGGGERAMAQFTKIVRSLRFMPARTPVISSLTGQVAGDEISTPEYWLQSTGEPVQLKVTPGALASFSPAPQVLLEIGPQSGLLQSSRSARPASDPVHCLASLLPSVDEAQALAMTLAELYAHGARINWRAYAGDSRPHARLPLYAFSRQRYWLDDELPTANNQQDAQLAEGARAAAIAAELSPSAPDWERLHAQPEGLQIAALTALARSELSEALGIAAGELDMHASLHQMGLDSLMAMKLRNRVEQLLGVRLPVALLMTDLSATSLVAHMHEHRFRRMPIRDLTTENADASLPTDSSAFEGEI